MALKLINSDLSVDPVFRSRFVNAARLARGWTTRRRPDAGSGETAGGRLWMTMPFVEGLPGRGTPIVSFAPGGCPARALRVVRRIAEALDHIHDRGDRSR